MISVETAKQIILDNTNSLAPLLMQLTNAAGKVLAQDVFSNIKIPAWPQSSMDGYAFAFQDFESGIPLKIVGESAAGNSEQFELKTGNAIRIFTGAVVPDGADTVVMQEKVAVEKGHLIIQDNNIVNGYNVRAAGSEIKENELAMSAGTLLMPGAVGFLAGIGFKEVLVYPFPAISLIVTGNELQPPGKELLNGQVYESNSFMLLSALKQMQISNVNVYNATDNLEIVKQVFRDAMDQNDLVILTGGVSVGDYDFVAKAAEEIGVEKLFHKIKQKPGKPFYFGKKDHQLVFGLPGNPSSVLTCFYEYVEPSLKKMANQKSAIQVLNVPLAQPIKKTAGLTHFLKGYYNGENVSVLSGQESYRLRSFSLANCLVKLDEEITDCNQNDLVEIHLLPN